jgi:WD40 repeat protein
MEHEDNVSGVTFSPDGLFAATRTTSGDAYLWDLRSGQSVRVAVEGYVNRLAFSPDSNSLATAEGDTVAEKDGRSSAVVLGSGAMFDGLADGDVGTEDHVDSGISNQPAKKTLGVRLWDVATGAQTLYLPHAKPVAHVLFSPDGTRLATDMSLKRTDAVQLWDTKTGERIADMQASPRGEGIDAKAFSSDGQYLAGNTYKEVLVWEVATGREITRLLHDVGVGDIAFTGNGQYVAVANGDKISIWDWMNNRKIANMNHGGSVTEIAFSPDNSRLISASQDDTVRVWAWQKNDLVADACSRLERNLTHEEWRTYLSDERYVPTCPDLPVAEK